MAMTLRLSEDETKALRARADHEGRSMQEVARTAIRDYVSGREQRLRDAVAQIRDEDAELLKRLGS